MKTFYPPINLEHIVHIYPANLLEFINGDCKRYYIVDGSVVMYLDTTSNIYTKYVDIVVDDWHNVSQDCYDQTTFDIISFQSPSREYNMEQRFAFDSTGNPQNKQFYFNYDTLEILDFDGTSFQTFTTLNEFLIFGRDIYYISDNNVLMKRDIVDGTEDEMFDLTGDFWLLPELGIENSFWVMFAETMHRVHEDKIVTILARKDDAAPIVNTMWFMYNNMIYKTDVNAGSPSMYIGY